MRGTSSLKIVCSAFMLLSLMFGSAFGKSFKLISTSDESFNSLHRRFNDDIRITKRGESWRLTGLCNECGIDSRAKACACTERMCFRATPSEAFVCSALEAGQNLSQLESHTSDQELVLSFTENSQPQWIHLQLANSQDNSI